VDGSGYPMGLRGDQIPVGARVLSVIDAYQSMTLGRPYKEARTVESVVDELVRCSHMQFDAEVVDIFISVLREEGKLSAEQEREFHERLGRTTAGASQE